MRLGSKEGEPKIRHQGYTKKHELNNEILRKSTKVRQVKTEMYNPKVVFLVPYQTKLEREADIALWAQLKETGAKNKNSRFKIRAGRIVNITSNQT